MAPSNVPAAPDSLSRLNAGITVTDEQLKKHWFKAAADTDFDTAKLPKLCEALSSRKGRSRLEFVLEAQDAFADPHARLCTLTRLLLEYSTRRASSGVVQDKWLKARRELLQLRPLLPETLRNVLLFNQLEHQSEDQPPKRPRRLSWRDR